MIIDTNVHLTISDQWGNKKNLEKEFFKIYKKYHLRGFACVGIKNMEKYDNLKFFNKFNKKKNIYLVPALDLNKSIEKQLRLFKKHKCKILKIHPRSFDKTMNDFDLEKIFYYCNKENFKIFLCTYFNDNPNNFYTSDPKYIFSKSYKRYPDLKVLLMHGGCERILEFSELIRFSKNLYLDLSLTILKYTGSSVDHDIKFLFNNFDKKITLGSDFPEFNYDIFIKKIRYFLKGLNKEKNDNICYKNFLNFIK